MGRINKMWSRTIDQSEYLFPDKTPRNIPNETILQCFSEDFPLFPQQERIIGPKRIVIYAPILPDPASFDSSCFVVDGTQRTPIEDIFRKAQGRTIFSEEQIVTPYEGFLAFRREYEVSLVYPKRLPRNKDFGEISLDRCFDDFLAQRSSQ